MIHAVIFDMDGLMFDTERLYMKGWKLAGEKLGFTITDDQLCKLRGTIHAKQKVLFSEWYGEKVDHSAACEIRRSYSNAYIEEHSIPLKKGLKELLTYMKERKIPAAVATSSSRAVAKHYCDLAQITDLIDTYVCGDEVVNGKPHPEVFQTAALKLNVPIECCLILEDSFNGIRAAHASGGFAGMVPDLLMPTEEIRQLCDYVFTDLTEVITLLKNQNS